MNYKAFFDGCKKNITFESDKGLLNIQDLFHLPVEDLTDMYRELKQKVVVEEDPLLSDVISANGDDTLRFEIVKSIILYRKEQAKRNELLEKKKQLEQMLAEIELNKLRENPEAIMSELDQIREMLGDGV